MGVIHKGRTAGDSADGLAAIDQGCVDPSVTVHKVEVITRPDVSREAGSEWKLGSLWDTDALQLSIDPRQLGIEKAHSAGDSQPPGGGPHKVDI